MSTPIKIKRYGWIPQHPDQRDLTFTPVAKVTVLPSHVDLRTSGHMPTIYDQGDLGSCVANSTAAAFEYELKKQGLADFTPSRLFIYYNGRVLEGTVSYDSGLMVRDGLKVVNQTGACNEVEWPYNINQFTVDPTTQCFTDAAKNKALIYQSVAQNLNTIKTALSQGYTVVFGCTVYESFESATATSTGNIPLPGRNETVLGGHSMLIVGYNDATQRFIIRNSWGTTWGAAGYGTMPYAYLTNANLASDFWLIKSVEENSVTVAPRTAVAATANDEIKTQLEALKAQIAKLESSIKS